MPAKNSLVNVKSRDPILTKNSLNNVVEKNDVVKPKKNNVTKRLQLLLTEKEFSNLEKKAGLAGVAAYLRNEIRTKTDFLE